jgi:ABC-type branched-subunit amino acid transport system ATPase component
MTLKDSIRERKEVNRWGGYAAEEDIRKVMKELLEEEGLFYVPNGHGIYKRIDSYSELTPEQIKKVDKYILREFKRSVKHFKRLKKMMKFASHELKKEMMGELDLDEQ